MNTANKRSSAIMVGLPWRSMYPLPDGTIAQLDRQHSAFMYAGISAGEEQEEVVVAYRRYKYAWARQNRHYRAFKPITGPYN